MERIGAILEEQVANEKVVVLCFGNQEFFVVADGFTVKENQWDIFESPTIEFYVGRAVLVFPFPPKSSRKVPEYWDRDFEWS